MKTALLMVALLGPVERIDGAVQGFVQSARSGWLERPMRAASDFGSPVTFFGALLGIAVVGGPAGVATARLALLTAAPTNLAVEGLKRAVNRQRPDGEHRRSNASFPSSHAANAFALAAVLARRWRRVAPAFWIGAGLIGFSRIYLNRHFLSDVLVGAAIGILCAWIVVRLKEGGGSSSRKA